MTELCRICTSVCAQVWCTWCWSPTLKVRCLTSHWFPSASATTECWRNRCLHMSCWVSPNPKKAPQYVPVSPVLHHTFVSMLTNVLCATDVIIQGGSFYLISAGSRGFLFEQSWLCLPRASRSAGSAQGKQSPPGSLWQHARELWPAPISPTAVWGQDKPLPVQPRPEVAKSKESHSQKYWGPIYTFSQLKPHIMIIYKFYFLWPYVCSQRSSTEAQRRGSGLCELAGSSDGTSPRGGLCDQPLVSDGLPVAPGSCRGPIRGGSAVVPAQRKNPLAPEAGAGPRGSPKLAWWVRRLCLLWML